MVFTAGAVFGMLVTTPAIVMLVGLARRRDESRKHWLMKLLSLSLPALPKYRTVEWSSLFWLPTSESGTYVLPRNGHITGVQECNPDASDIVAAYSVPNQSVYSTRIFSTRLRSPLTFRPPLFVMLSVELTTVLSSPSSAVAGTCPNDPLNVA